MHGRNIGEREERGRRRRGSRWGGCTRKTGVKSPQKFSTKPLIVLASGKRGGKPRIYNAPMANSFPLSRHAYASVAYTCRKNSIAGENRSSRFRRRGGEISSHFPFFHFSPHFVSFARFHFDRAEYIYKTQTSTSALSYRSSNQFGTRCNICRFRMYFARRRSTPRIIGRVGRETFTRSIQHRSIFEILIARSLYHRKGSKGKGFDLGGNARTRSRKPRASNL